MKRFIAVFFVLGLAATAMAQSKNDPEPYELGSRPFTTVKTPSTTEIQLIFEGDVQGIAVTCEEAQPKNFTVRFINSNDFGVKIDYILQTAVSNSIRVGNITVPAGGVGVCNYTTQHSGDILASAKMTVEKRNIGQAVVKEVIVTHHADSLLGKQ